MDDIIIIGGGPAGMSAAIYAARAGKRVTLFEGNRLGGTLATLKRIENFPGSISNSGAEIAARMEAQVRSFGVNIVSEFVSGVMKTEGGFEVFTDTGSFGARYVVFCGGIRRKRPAAERKFRGNGISYCAVCDGNFYKGKTVAVIGDGEAAKRDVAYLLPLCKKVYQVCTFSPAEGAEAVLGSVEDFVGDETLKGIVVGGRTIEVDGAFIAMGGAANELISGLKMEDGLVVNDDGRTNVEGFFVAGDAAKGSMRQVVSACFEGARAAGYCK